jgi:hypothetical protein
MVPGGWDNVIHLWILDTLESIKIVSDRCMGQSNELLRETLPDDNHDVFCENLRELTSLIRCRFGDGLFPAGADIPSEWQQFGTSVRNFRIALESALDAFQAVGVSVARSELPALYQETGLKLLPLANCLAVAADEVMEACARNESARRG